jgi:hypothetical protein
VRKIVEEVAGEGLEALLGKRVCLWCVNYIYHGKLIGVNDTDVLLDDAKVVYETGPLCDPTFGDAQALPDKWYVRISAIESYGVVDHD